MNLMTEKHPMTENHPMTEKHPMTKQNQFGKIYYACLPLADTQH